MISLKKDAEFEYDFKAGAGYVYLKKIKAGEAVKTKEVPGALVLLDFDKNSKLIGIELVNLGVKETEL